LRRSGTSRNWRASSRRSRRPTRSLAGQFADEGDHDTILVNLSGRGDKDMQQAAELLSLD